MSDNIEVKILNLFEGDPCDDYKCYRLVVERHRDIKITIWVEAYADLRWRVYHPSNHSERWPHIPIKYLDDFINILNEFRDN